MTVEANIFSALGPLIGNRVYPDEAPIGAALPFIVYQQVGGAPLNFLAGVPDKRNGRFQFDVWSTTRKEAAALIRQVEDTLRANQTLLADTMTGALATREPETNLYGFTQDFSIWFTN